MTGGGGGGGGGGGRHGDLPFGMTGDAGGGGRQLSAPLDGDCPVLDRVPQAMARVLASNALRHSPQLRRFFDYIVTESLAGRGHKLKAYSIATEALGRSVDFDAGRDPIVRVEATRLRSALATFYLEEGAHETVRFRIAPGSYQPLVEIFPDAAVAAPDAATVAAPLMAEAESIAGRSPGDGGSDPRWRKAVAVVIGLCAIQVLSSLYLAWSVTTIIANQRRIEKLFEGQANSPPRGLGGGVSEGALPVPLQLASIAAEPAN